MPPKKKTTAGKTSSEWKAYQDGYNYGMRVCRARHG